VKWIQGYFVFETPNALGEGFARLKQDPKTGAFRVLTLSLTLHQFKNHIPLAGPNRPIGAECNPIYPALNWLEERELISSFSSHSPHPNPTVIIVGAGHSGLMLAARLKRLGILALIIDKGDRVGDSWRKRYRSLVLHDVIWGCHFPYLPFPDDWPTFIPKDKFADWMECYAIIMELNVWLKSTVEPNSTSYNGATETWSITIRKGDGSLHQLECKHIVQATGHSGEPNIPHFEGEETFRGSMYHSSLHDGKANWKGKKAVIIGSGNSGHDITQDFYNAGAAEVTMVQRSATMIFSRKVINEKVRLGLGYHEGGPPIEEPDLSLISVPYKANEPYAMAMHKVVLEEDKELIEGLERVGFKIYGKDSAGLYDRYFQVGGGYYIDVGCSSLIVDGKVKVKQGQEIERIEETGIRFVDGSFVEADVIVVATGYKSMRESCRKIFGSELADQTGPVWGLDSTGEVNGIWRDSGSPGFWYIGGGILFCRMYSKYLGLWIQAIEQKIAPKGQHPLINGSASPSP
jgi:hypothetical protein